MAVTRRRASAPSGGDSGFEALRLEVRGRGMGEPGPNGAEDIGQIEWRREEPQIWGKS